MQINQEASSDDQYTTIKFSVKDTGIGIKETNYKKIFKSFAQEDNSTSRKFGGTGLGLAISKQLLQLMNSELQFVSNYGKGSDFYFIVKFKKVNHLNDDNALFSNVISHDLKDSQGTIKNKKVLIVEDNKINMLIVKKLITTMISNATIIEAVDGNEAIEKCKTTKLDIILMDVQMPNKNGFDATKEIRELKDFKNVPIIAVTAGIMLEEREKCFKSGMNDYLAKPIHQPDLELILHKWLDKNKLF